MEGCNCHPGVGLAVQKQASVSAGNHAPDIGNKPMGVTPLAGRLPLRPVERAHAREHLRECNVMDRGSVLQRIMDSEQEHQSTALVERRNRSGWQTGASAMEQARGDSGCCQSLGCKGVNRNNQGRYIAGQSVTNTEPDTSFSETKHQMPFLPAKMVGCYSGARWRAEPDRQRRIFDDDDPGRVLG